MNRRLNPSCFFLGLLCVLIAIWFDQFTKLIITDLVMRPPRTIYVTSFLNMVLGFNNGVGFGLFSEVLKGRPGILIIASSGLVAGLLLWMAMAKDYRESAGLGLMAGGAAGNTFDRIQRGRVTDFIDFHLADWHWPTFNFADVAIVVGTFILVSGLLLRPDAADKAR